MTNLISDAFIQAKELVMKAMGELVADGTFPAEPVPAFNTEIPADSKNGDVSTNAAMVCARPFRNNPRKIAEAIVSKIDLNGSYFARCEVAGPGFINFFYSTEWYATVVAAVLEQKEKYGETDLGAGKSVLVEFVSANPTGPMHIGNARGGAIGDCLASVLEKAGYEVAREFYINDAGNQIEKFKTSLEVRYLQIYKPETELPEDAYQGQDIIDHANAFNEIYGDKYVNADSEERRQALCDFALPKNIQKLHDDLGKYRIQYDKWFNESTLHKDGSVQRVIEQLKASGHTYEKDGALWYKATEFGSDKDDVLVRQNGNPTYFAADIAYHRNKFVKRGFDLCIDIWGADHHGHVARMKGAMEALGLDSSKLDVILMQLVRLTQNGEVVRMSKRTGKAIQLGDLLDEVPVDSARFLFNMREANSQMEFDLDLAVKQDSQNPVYYVQYARARICSILKALAADGITPYPCTDEELRLLTAPAELELIRHLSAYTSEIIEAAKDYDPARITRYVITLATLFHKFYDACRVKGDNPHLTNARLTLCIATSTVICNVLNMFKISTPESM